MTNLEILDSWNNHRHISQLNLDKFYSTLFIDEDGTVDDFLKLFHLHRNDLDESDFITERIVKIDGLFKKSSKLMEGFIKSFVFGDVNEVELVDGINETKENLGEIYNEIIDLMNEIKWEMGNYWND